MNKINQSILLGLSILAASGCAPEVGSDAWCKQMDETPKGDWSLNDTGEYAKSCIFRKSEDDDKED